MMRSLFRGGAVAALSLAALLGAGSVPTQAQVAPPFTTLYSFGGDNFTTGGGDGQGPQADLLVGHDGALYGTTTYGPNGTVFRITPSGAYTKLYEFAYENDGGNPSGSLVEDKNGNLYGTTYDAGLNGYGTVFQLSPSGALTTLHAFNYNDGASPAGGLIFGKGGALYGTTSGGGAHGNGGTIFRMTTAGVLTTLFNFNYADGLYPVGNLLADKDGNLYGVTYGGGYTGGDFSSQAGTAFAFVPGIAFLPGYDFSTPTGGPPPTNYDGANPYAGLIRDNTGNLYGTTSAGGAYGYGTVFVIRPVGTTFGRQFITLHSFTNGDDGGNPFGDLRIGKDGALYGTAGYGGTNGNGTIFRLTPDGGTFTTLYNFSATNSSFINTDGVAPSAGLTIGPDGNFYGTASGGGAYGGGTIFKLTMTPVISSFAPQSGPVGTQVTLTGVNFTETTSVKLGSASAAFTINSDTSLTVTIPAGATSTRVTVTNPFGRGATSRAFHITH
jgi:uncharacterized repeat protein (TIGR03803 family)